MIQHPVPQNVTTYQFRLIGNMTIKQFLILLAGGGLGLLAYTTNLPDLLKWPLVILGIGSGALLAFVPYEERTLDQWAVNFFKAIYRPTHYHWRRVTKWPELFDWKPNQQRTNQSEIDYSPLRRQQASQFLSSIEAPSQKEEKTIDPLDVFSRANDEELASLYAQVAPAVGVRAKEESPILEEEIEVAKPDLQARPRQLSSPTVLFASSLPSAESMATVATAQPAPTARIFEESSEPAQEQIVPVAPVATQQQTKEEAPLPVASAPTAEVSMAFSQLGSQVQGEAATPAVFNEKLPFPTLPTEPNIILGMVYGPDGKIITNAIIDILDENNSTVRALKTNGLGQFSISKALPAGSYFVEVESAGTKFPRYAIDLIDEILKPMEIRAIV